jgi:UDP-N-acetylmuramoyl-L-alanyl-D-glutamate--2,6-diaminopimelate ligase
MMLVELLSGYASVPEDVEISGLSLDSRKIKPGDAFIALSGTVQHGITFARQAAKNGAAAIVYDPVGEFKKIVAELEDMVCVAVENLSQNIGVIAARFFGFPTQQLAVIGITGTNGKTTCSQLLGQMLPDCGFIGTLGWGDSEHLNATENTTPDAISIQRIFHRFVRQGKTSVAMEVSSHGLKQGRVNGVAFAGAVFTNISRDHLDYHGSMDAYIEAKLKLLAMPGLSFVVMNMDDQYTDNIISAVPTKVKKLGFTRQENYEEGMEILSASNIEYTLQGIKCDLLWQEDQTSLSTPLVGEFNLENSLAVICVLIAMGKSLSEAAVMMVKAPLINGRMERVSKAGNPLQVFVDYAHTPDALERVLKSLKLHCQNKLFLVFGCGGDRDQGKRSQMGHIATQWADKVLLTDDNPRYENAENIIDDILVGCQHQKVTVIQDRDTAIREAIRMASNQDLVLIAGKGHEDYQEQKGQRRHFSDRDVAVDALEARGALSC